MIFDKAGRYTSEGEADKLDSGVSITVDELDDLLDRLEGIRVLVNKLTVFYPVYEKIKRRIFARLKAVRGRLESKKPSA